MPNYQYTWISNVSSDPKEIFSADGDEQANSLVNAIRLQRMEIGELFAQEDLRRIGENGELIGRNLLLKWAP